MKPGREMDVLIAEKVMGHEIVKAKTVPLLEWDLKGGMRPPRWVLYGIEEDDNVTKDDGMLPKLYSTDIAAAWEVMERLHADGWSFSTDARNSKVFGDERHACFIRDMGNMTTKTASSTQATTPYAICLAALRAVGIEVPD